MLKFTYRSVKCNVKSAMEYKKSFLIQSIFMFINNGFFLVFWLVIFNANGGNIDGVEMKDIFYLWSISTFAYGLALFFCGGCISLNKHIITGGLDAFLVQPKAILLNILFSNCEFSAFGDLIYGLVIGIFAVNNIWEYFAILCFGVIGAVFFVCAYSIVRMTSIWLGDVEGLAHVYEVSTLITFTNYPEQIFGKVVKFLMYTIAPAMYIVHLPLRIIKEFNGLQLLYVILAMIIFVILTNVMMKVVLKRYESGNSMAMRM